MGGPPLLHPPAAGLEFSVPIEVILPAAMTLSARLCGRTVARSGDGVVLAAYPEGSAKFDHAIADFAETYGVTDGKVQSTTEIQGGVDRRRDVRAWTQSVAQNGSPAHSAELFN
jgi:hypothetical protein